MAELGFCADAWLSALPHEVKARDVGMSSKPGVRVQEAAAAESGVASAFGSAARGNPSCRRTPWPMLTAGSTRIRVGFGRALSASADEDGSSAFPA